jgi:hypothetical protein
MQVADLILTLNKVLIIGLGQLGLAAAKYVKEDLTHTDMISIQTLWR